MGYRIMKKKGENPLDDLISTMTTKSCGAYLLRNIRQPRTSTRPRSTVRQLRLCKSNVDACCLHYHVTIFWRDQLRLCKSNLGSYRILLTLPCGNILPDMLIMIADVATTLF